MSAFGRWVRAHPYTGALLAGVSWGAATGLATKDWLAGSALLYGTMLGAGWIARWTR